MKQQLRFLVAWCLVVSLSSRKGPFFCQSFSSPAVHIRQGIHQRSDFSSGRFRRSFHSKDSLYKRTSLDASLPIPLHKDHAVKTTVAGRIWPILAKFIIGPKKAKEVAQNLVLMTHWKELVLLAGLAYATRPLIDFIHDRFEEEDEEGTKRIWKRQRVAHIISSASLVSLSVYVVDMLCVILRTLGFTFPSLWDITGVYSKTAYSIWGLRRALDLKQALLCRIYNLKPDHMGQFEIIDRLINGVSVTLASLFLLDWLSVETGLALRGLFAFGSVGTLAFTLASRDIVGELVSGVALTATNKFVRGETVQFGDKDGTKGKIMKMGWLQTTMRQSDNTVTTVPNAKLAGQKISNLSRVLKSQVEQTLRFHYEDIDEIPAVVESIKDEIKKSCPKLVTDGSRPFRVYLTNYAPEYLEVTVNTHYSIPPLR